MPENPRLLSLGMNGIPERSVGHSSSWPKAPAFRPEIGLLDFSGQKMGLERYFGCQKYDLLIRAINRLQIDF